MAPAGTVVQMVQRAQVEIGFVPAGQVEIRDGLQEGATLRWHAPTYYCAKAIRCGQR